jgi:DNA-binding NtrC family response regulator
METGLLESTLGSNTESMKSGAKTVVLVSPDAALRRRLNLCLSGMRWRVREARGGAEALGHLEAEPAEALLLDAWLPDLDVAELTAQIHSLYPTLDLLRIDGEPVAGSVRSLRRHELLYAVREMPGIQHETHLAEPVPSGPKAPNIEAAASFVSKRAVARTPDPAGARAAGTRGSVSPIAGALFSMAVEEMVGNDPQMLELGHMIRLVAPRSTTVLIEGETGTGKELVARALHRLSPRSNKPFVVLNCAAIPEALLEAELFGHTRGSFTGAVQARTGRIEAANGGTLFLDEIGEMAMPLQAKMLRFLASGELQRVGDNEPIHVDVRVIAATHQQLERRAEEGAFRLDLYHRLAVFPVLVPALRDRPNDIAALAEHFLSLLGRVAPRKTLSAAALQLLEAHHWPGNVRELGHVLERATILAEDSPIIRAEDIRIRSAVRR